MFDGVEAVFFQYGIDLVQTYLDLVFALCSSEGKKFSLLQSSLGTPFAEFSFVVILLTFLVAEEELLVLIEEAVFCVDVFYVAFSAGVDLVLFFI